MRRTIYLSKRYVSPSRMTAQLYIYPQWKPIGYCIPSEKSSLPKYFISPPIIIRRSETPRGILPLADLLKLVILSCGEEALLLPPVVDAVDEAGGGGLSKQRVDFLSIVLGTGRIGVGAYRGVDSLVFVKLGQLFPPSPNP